MVEYSSLKKGDILKVTANIENGPKKGDLVRVVEGFRKAVNVEDEDGKFEYELTGDQHAEALEKTGINGEFPSETKDRVTKEAKVQKEQADQAVKDAAKAAKDV